MKYQRFAELVRNLLRIPSGVGGSGSAHPDLQALTRYILQESSDGERISVDEHLSDCDDCLEQLRVMRHIRMNFDSIWESWNAEEHGRSYKQWRMAKAIVQAEIAPELAESTRARIRGLLERMNSSGMEIAVSLFLDKRKRMAVIASEMSTALTPSSAPYDLRLKPAFAVGADIRFRQEGVTKRSTEKGAGHGRTSPAFPLVKGRSREEMINAEGHRSKAGSLLAAGQLGEAISHLQTVIDIDARAAQLAWLDINREGGLIGRVAVDSRRRTASLILWDEPKDSPPRLAILVPDDEKQKPLFSELLPAAQGNYHISEFKGLGDGSHTLVLEPTD